MILRRLGNKSRLSEKILSLIPYHDVYLEPFFGTGAIYFKKPRARHNFINDIDDDVFNLWNVYTHKWEELLEAIHNMPNSQSLFRYWRKNKETNDVLKALRFIFLSNFSYIGASDCFKISAVYSKQVLIDNYIKVKGLLSNDYICNLDFRDFYNDISIRQRDHLTGKTEFTWYAYNDPPYLGTSDNYSHSFKEQDSVDLFDINCNLSSKYPNKYFFSYSEFKHPFIIEQAKQRNLNIIEIGERQNIKNRRTEILVCNYEVERGLFS